MRLSRLELLAFALPSSTSDFASYIDQLVVSGAVDQLTDLTLVVHTKQTSAYRKLLVHSAKTLQRLHIKDSFPIDHYSAPFVTMPIFSALQLVTYEANTPARHYEVSSLQIFHILANAPHLRRLDCAEALCYNSAASTTVVQCKYKRWYWTMIRRRCLTPRKPRNVWLRLPTRLSSFIYGDLPEAGIFAIFRDTSHICTPSE